MLEPVKDHIALEPVLRSEIRAAEVKKRSGILIPPPDNKRHGFEGLPNIGKVYALPAGYDGPFKPGQYVIFAEVAPKGVEWEGAKLFILKLEQIIGLMAEDWTP